LVEISIGGMVWSARELLYGLVTLIDVTGDPFVSVYMLGLIRRERSVTPETPYQLFTNYQP